MWGSRKTSWDGLANKKTTIVDHLLVLALDTKRISSVFVSSFTVMSRVESKPKMSGVDGIG